MITENQLYINDLKSVMNEPLPWDKIDGSSVLITGANGLIASFFVDCLMYRNKTLNGNIEVFALCRNKEKSENRFKSYLDNNSFNLIIQDVCEPLNLNVKFDYIIHAASNAHPMAFAAYPVETMRANILGSINLLEYAKKYNPEKFLFVSSTEIYGRNNSGLNNGLKEEDCGYIDCANIRSAYPESKRASETLRVSYGKQYGINTVSVRPGYIYGPTIQDDNTRADAQFIKKAVDGENIVMKSAGNQLRSYCYVSDMVSAMLYVMLLGENGGAYNIANKNCAVTIREFAETAADIAGVKVVFENPGDIEKSGYSLIGNGVLDAGKLESLGWSAKVNLREGLKRTISIR
ncbi:MAG: NAD-dependent epimerase/dehydratase family protein [Oscillospiraceae bacterium]|nr:NAD-dependent epimerase/dehydratase family protein [Oscillospiraceae bacterium]